MYKPEDIIRVEHPIDRRYRGGLYKVIFRSEANNTEYSIYMHEDEYNKLMWSMQLLIEGASQASIEHLVDSIEAIIHEIHYKEKAEAGI